MDELLEESSRSSEAAEEDEEDDNSASWLSYMEDLREVTNLRTVEVGGGVGCKKQII